MKKITIFFALISFYTFGQTNPDKPLTNEILIYNALSNTQFKMKLTPKVLKNKIASLFKLQTYFDAACGTQNPEWQISPEDLKIRLSSRAESRDLHLIAVLPNLKLPFEVHQTIPIQEFDVDQFEINNEKTYVMVCQRGLNSYKATKQLKEKHPDMIVLNLTGGISNY